MASDSTFEGLWRRLLVHAPNLPIPLAQEFINTAYSRALGYCGWSGLRAYNEFYIPDPYTTGGVTIAQDSQTVTGVGTTFTSAMAGRQLYVGQQAPVYTITAVDTGAQTLTLDRTYKDAAVTNGTYSINLSYISMPSDFLELQVVKDIANNWKLRLDFTQEDIDFRDVKRTVVGTGWTFSYAAPNASGTIRYELWPRPSADHLYGYTYIRKPSLLSAASDAPIYPIRGDVIREGALAELALWPGVSMDNPNPYKDMNLHREHEKRFWKGVYDAEKEDQGIRQSNISYASFDLLPYAPIDAAYFQTHDVIF